MGFEVRDKVALVTGANRGIGAAITEKLLAEGAKKVYAAVRNIDSVQAVVQQHGDRVTPIAFDLADESLIHQAAENARDVQLVINNAGVLRSAQALSKDAFADFEFEWNRNVLGLMRTAQAFAPVLKANGGGAFVQLNSVASFKSFPDFATYCASKAAAYSITQALRVNLREQGTLVVSVHPGPIKTDMASDAGLNEIAEPPTLVADALIEGLRNEQFHVFPDSMARQFGAAYKSFATGVIEAEMSEG